MKCPFCGGEMREGGIVLPRTRSFLDTFQWLPPGGDGDRWNTQDSVELAALPPEGDESISLGELLFAPSPDTVGWYCEACGRAVAVFQKNAPCDPFPDVPDGPLPSVEELRSPLPPAPDAPSSKKDPWEKGGLFRRKKKKPDWEL